MSEDKPLPPLPPHVARARSSHQVAFEAHAIKEWPTACERHGSDPQHHKEYAVILRILFNPSLEGPVKSRRIPAQYIALSISTGNAAIEENYPRLSGKARKEGQIIAELDPKVQGISFVKVGWNKDTYYELHVEDTRTDPPAANIRWTYSLNRPAFMPNILPLFLVLKHPIDEPQLTITMQIEKLHKYESRWKTVMPLFKSAPYPLNFPCREICLKEKSGSSLAQQVHDTQDIDERDKICPWYPWFPTQI